VHCRFHVHAQFRCDGRVREISGPPWSSISSLLQGWKRASRRPWSSKLPKDQEKRGKFDSSWAALIDIASTYSTVAFGESRGLATTDMQDGKPRGYRLLERQSHHAPWALAQEPSVNLCSAIQVRGASSLSTAVRFGCSWMVDNAHPCLAAQRKLHVKLFMRVPSGW
jgi:hypothetical protein